MPRSVPSARIAIAAPLSLLAFTSTTAADPVNGGSLCLVASHPYATIHFAVPLSPLALQTTKCAHQSQLIISAASCPRRVRPLCDAALPARLTNDDDDDRSRQCR
mmetsp:Transcript_26076/g.56049  ORF Transcript_26076/g.56049 Transcript_26076/m.56049 type:complete len:105 (+) Transcript_26076:603-917(+)